MTRFFHRHVLLPAYETLWQRRRIFEYLKELKKSQWLTREELERKQFQALQRLLAHAYANCPFYRHTWTRAGCDPQQVGSLDDFRRWPLIERSHISENRLQMRSQLAGTRLLSKSTGGSSGQPLQFDL